jgi:hypothetical protein
MWKRHFNLAGAYVTPISCSTNHSEIQTIYLIFKQSCKELICSKLKFDRQLFLYTPKYDSTIFIHQLMHLYIYYQITKTLYSFDSSYMFRHIVCHHQGAQFSWLKSLVKNIRS